MSFYSINKVASVSVNKSQTVKLNSQKPIFAVSTSIPKYFYRSYTPYNRLILILVQQVAHKLRLSCVMKIPPLKKVEMRSCLSKSYVTPLEECTLNLSFLG